MADSTSNPPPTDPAMDKLLRFIQTLDRRRIFRRLTSVRDAVMVEVHVPGERWEVEFFSDGHLEAEVFRSSGHILRDGEAGTALDELLLAQDEPDLASEKWRQRGDRQRLSE